MQMVEFFKEILFHEMQLLHPGSVRDLNKKNSLFYAFRIGLGSDTGTDGLKPDFLEAPVHRF